MQAAPQRLLTCHMAMKVKQHGGMRGASVRTNGHIKGGKS